MNQILCIAIALLVGLLSSRLMKFLHLPNVTGYLIAGIVFGPYVLGQYIAGWSVDPTSPTSISSISWISDIALGFIAFTIGCSFKLSSLKAVGRRVIIITIAEALGGALITLGGLLIGAFCSSCLAQLALTNAITAIRITLICFINSKIWCKGTKKFAYMQKKVYLCTKNFEQP